ncbi:hypothetical protein ACMYYO_00980 [Dermacoccaceae bacterium W4C1]
MTADEEEWIRANGRPSQIPTAELQVKAPDVATVRPSTPFICEVLQNEVEQIPERRVEALVHAIETMEYQPAQEAVGGWFRIVSDMGTEAHLKAVRSKNFGGIPVSSDFFLNVRSWVGMMAEDPLQTRDPSYFAALLDELDPEQEFSDGGEFTDHLLGIAEDREFDDTEYPNIW